VRDELRSIVAERLLVRATDVCRGDAFDALVSDVAARRRDPFDAADEVLAEV
jgi:hypothetical protein